MLFQVIDKIQIFISQDEENFKYSNCLTNFKMTKIIFEQAKPNATVGNQWTILTFFTQHALDKVEQPNNAHVLTFKWSSITIFRIIAINIFIPHACECNQELSLQTQHKTIVANQVWKTNSQKGYTKKNEHCPYLDKPKSC